MHSIQCAWKGDSSKFEPAWPIHEISTAVARRHKTQICCTGCMFHAPTSHKYIPDFGTRVWVLYNARGWANGQCFGLSRCSWPILQLWQYTSKHRFLNKNPKIGSRWGIGMGSKSGWAHALGCPEWVPPGAGSPVGVSGKLWWFPCPNMQ